MWGSAKRCVRSVARFGACVGVGAGAWATRLMGAGDGDAKVTAGPDIVCSTAILSSS